MLTDILLTLLLVLLNGFFVAAEFSIVKVRYSQIQLRAAKGNRFAKVAQRIINHLDTYLSATQLGITLASLGLGWIGEPVMAKIIGAVVDLFNISITEQTLHSISVPIGFLVITMLHIVFGELAPKSIAIRKAEPTTLVISYPLLFFFFAFRPFISLMNAISNLFLKMVGIQPVGEQDIHSVEELRLLVKQSKEAGEVMQESYEIIENAFKFPAFTARQVMLPRQKIVAVDVSLSREEIISFVLENGYSRVPVYQSSLDTILGILYVKDIFTALHSKRDFRIEELLHPVYYVVESQRISKILSEFKRQHLHMAIVVDEFGGTQGLITLEDVLEELVGEIQDEDDVDKKIVEKVNSGVFVVQAKESLLDINEYLPYPLTLSESYTTLSGMILSVLGHIPAQGDVLMVEQYEVTILKVQNYAVTTVELKVVANPLTAETE